MRFRSIAATSLLAVPVLLTGTAILPARAAAPTADRTLVLELSSAGNGTSVTVPAALSLTAAQRGAVTRSLLPGTTELRAAEHDATAAGLTVLGTNGSEVTVTGSQAVIDALVGDNPAAPVTPTAWRGSVAGIIDASTGTGMWHSHGSPQTYASLSQSYGGGVPSSATPALTTATPIIATLQLSGWDPSVLTSFARSVYTNAGYDPVASGQFTAVNAGRSAAYSTSDGEGDAEVSLDQETLLAAAPQLKQRAYFAKNSASGYSTALQDIYNDVVTGLPIMAVSTSWGACETTDSVATRTAIDATLAKLTAAGVTVFAASGDSGTDDCFDASDNPSTGVDFPASDPHVIGVGATTHPNGAAAPAPDTAWSQGQTTSQSEGGSGGGVSSIFARPSYQDGATTTAGRGVPDLAVDGDPMTGVRTVIVVDHDSGAQASVVSGGTSLASPLAAAMIANVAASRSALTGSTVGFGDIHALLYAHPEAFTDVVATTQAYGEGTGPTAFPGVGYDAASGLGTPKLDVLSALLQGSAGTSTTVAAAVLNTAPTLKITSLTRPKSTSAGAVREMVGQRGNGGGHRLRRPHHRRRQPLRSRLLGRLAECDLHAARRYSQRRGDHAVECRLLDGHEHPRGPHR